MSFAVGDIVRMVRGDETTYCVLEVGDEYGIPLIKVDHPSAGGWWEHQFFTLADDVKADPRTEQAKTPKPPPDPPKEVDPVLVSLNEKLTLAAAAVIKNDADALLLITEALADVRTAIEQ
jgi:hypothetical protein